MRGEHINALMDAQVEEGSSPRARGARIEALAEVVTGGIIPACAGSTLDLRKYISDTGDHPRVRGEHSEG